MCNEQKPYSAFCVEKCPLGKEQAQKFLRESESISDAAIDMQMFVDVCRKTGCHYEESQAEEIKK